MNLSRQQILKGNYIYPRDLVTLRPTKHIRERLVREGNGFRVHTYNG